MYSSNSVAWTRKNLPLVNLTAATGDGNNTMVGVGSQGLIISSIGTTFDSLAQQASPTDQGLFSIAYHDSKFVAVGMYGVIIISTDSKTWTTRIAVSSDDSYTNLYSVASSKNITVTIGDGGTILYSPDGVAWTLSRKKTGTTGGGVSCAGNGNTFIAMGSYIIFTSPITSQYFYMASTDGITWTEDNLKPNIGIPISNGSQFVGRSYGEDIATSSDDGQTWVTTFSGTSIIQDISWGDKQFVAVGDSGAFLISSDAISWSQRSIGTTDDLIAVGIGDGRYVVLAIDSTGPLIFTSSDGMVWSQIASGARYGLSDVAWGSGNFVIVGDSGTILSSPDGMNWVKKNSGTSAPLNAITWGNDQFIVVGDGGTILTSPSSAQSVRARQSLLQQTGFEIINNMIHYTLVSSSPVGIRLCDLNGRKVFSASYKMQIAGHYAVKLPGTLPAGIYCLSYRKGMDRPINRIIIAK